MMLQAAILVALVKEGKSANSVLDYLLYHEDYKDYDDSYYPTSYQAPHHEPQPSYAHQEPSSYAAPPDSSYAHIHRQKRSADDAAEVQEVERLLVSAAARLDRDRCVLKMLCHLHNKATDTRTPEEKVLLQLLFSSQETLSSYNAALVTARKAGLNLKEATCDQVFPRCPLGVEELSSQLWQTLPCGNLVR